MTTFTKYFSLSLISSAVLFTGCSGGGGSAGNQALNIVEPAELVSQSSLVVDDNETGLISANTLLSWVSDWQENKPSHIRGRLFILQFNSAVSGNTTLNWVKHDDVNVFTYNAFDCCGSSPVRNDGVSNDPVSIPTGAMMDAMLQKTGINPEKDMIVMVMGENDLSEKAYSKASRLWYSFAYWGIDTDHLALMNGSATHQLHPTINSNVAALSDVFTQNTSSYLNNGTSSVTDVRTDATIINSSMQDVMEIASLEDKTGYLIVDSRSAAEYNGLVGAKTEETTCGADGLSQCFTAFDGRVRDAVNIDYKTTYNYNDQTTDLNADGVVDIRDSSSTFKTLGELQRIYSDAGYRDGDLILAYCRTGTRVASNVFAQMQILGYPTTVYDGGWIQWGKMAFAEDKNGQTMLDFSNPWRTDLPDYSESVTMNPDSSMVQQINGLNPFGTNTRQIIEADQDYKM